jgi:hypothetical protein
MLEARYGGVKVMPGTAAIGAMVPYWHKYLHAPLADGYKENK